MVHIKEDGSLILISNMADEHLFNSIQKQLRQVNEKSMSLLQLELAPYVLEANIRNMDIDIPLETLKALIKKNKNNLPVGRQI